MFCFVCSMRWENRWSWVDFIGPEIRNETRKTKCCACEISHWYVPKFESIDKKSDQWVGFLNKLLSSATTQNLEKEICSECLQTNSFQFWWFHNYGRAFDSNWFLSFFFSLLNADTSHKLAIHFVYGIDDVMSFFHSQISINKKISRQKIWHSHVYAYIYFFFIGFHWDCNSKLWAFHWSASNQLQRQGSITPIQQ